MPYTAALPHIGLKENVRGGVTAVTTCETAAEGSSSQMWLAVCISQVGLGVGCPVDAFCLVSAP